MGNIKQGILGGFNGKVGTVVGYARYGKSFMRALATNIKDANTELQHMVRARFKLLSQLTPAFLPAIQIGMARSAKAKRYTVGNRFFKLNWDLVTLDEELQASIDLTKVAVSEGTLPGASFRTPTYEGDLTVEAAYGADSDVPNTDAHDEVYLFVYQADLNEGVLSAAALRSEGSVSVKVPAAWSGMKVHVYGFAVGRGLTTNNLRSATTYLGSGNVE